MKFEECLNQLPQKLRDKLLSAMKVCHKDGFDERLLELKSRDFSCIGKAVNYSMRWDDTNEGHYYWRDVAKFYGEDEI